MFAFLVTNVESILATSTDDISRAKLGLFAQDSQHACKDTVRFFSRLASDRSTARVARIGLQAEESSQDSLGINLKVKGICFLFPSALSSIIPRFYPCFDWNVSDVNIYQPIFPCSRSYFCSSMAFRCR
jgi:hypothetical protein